MGSAKRDKNLTLLAPELKDRLEEMVHPHVGMLTMTIWTMQVAKLHLMEIAKTLNHMWNVDTLICVFTLLHLTNGSDCVVPTDGAVLMVAVIFNPRAVAIPSDLWPPFSH